LVAYLFFGHHTWSEGYIWIQETPTKRQRATWKKKEEKQIKRVENAAESKQKRRQRCHMALTFHQHWGDLKIGKEKHPVKAT